MIQNKIDSLALSRKRSAEETRITLVRRWSLLCEKYLPVITNNTIWRFSRETFQNEPSQGWKLHLSANILEACDLLEKIAPVLISQNVQFKAPNSLEELAKINCGLHYGYWQVGKFITVYPSTTQQAVSLAEQLHQRTLKFSSIQVPFDNQYLPGSSVFYRYGAFQELEIVDENGEKHPGLRSLHGEIVYDDRFQSVPVWISNPFPNNNFSLNPSETPLTTTYKVFRSLTQRGKGGTYQAFDLSSNPLRFCLIKEGRKNGELNWKGIDGSDLVKNEVAVLKELNNSSSSSKVKAPKIFSSFQIDGNIYLAMEFVEGKSLLDLMNSKRRRYSIRQILKFAIGIAGIVAEINRAGWIWNDCKPGNIIVTSEKFLRPIDFEGSFPMGQVDPFEWKTEFFSLQTDQTTSSETNDIYALGAVIYFLLTGKFYDPVSPERISKLRRKVPERFEEIVEKLLKNFAFRKISTADSLRNEFEMILNSL